MVDRIPVVLSQKCGFQLLGVPKIDSTTGCEMADAVFSIANEWNVADNIIGMSFDTTNSNSEEYNGACVLLEQ